MKKESKSLTLILNQNTMDEAEFLELINNILGKMNSHVVRPSLNKLSVEDVAYLANNLKYPYQPLKNLYERYESNADIEAGKAFFSWYLTHGLQTDESLKSLGDYCNTEPLFMQMQEEIKESMKAKKRIV